MLVMFQSKHVPLKQQRLNKDGNKTILWSLRITIKVGNTFYLLAGKICKCQIVANDGLVLATLEFYSCFEDGLPVRLRTCVFQILDEN